MRCGSRLWAAMRNNYLMKLSGNTILVTGGASGIGLALVERFVQRGNEVIICGRREDKLAEVSELLPGIHKRVCDVGRSAEREELYRWVTNEFPNVNVLVNNAGIQRRVDLTKNEDWKTTLA